MQNILLLYLPNQLLPYSNPARLRAPALYYISPLASHSVLFPLSIVSEDSLPGDQLGRRRRQVGSGASSSSMTTITLEFGDPPDVNISQSVAPSVAQEIQMAGEDEDSVDIEVCLLSISISSLEDYCNQPQMYPVLLRHQYLLYIDHSLMKALKCKPTALTACQVHIDVCR